MPLEMKPCQMDSQPSSTKLADELERVYFRMMYYTHRSNWRNVNMLNALFGLDLSVDFGGRRGCGEVSSARSMTDQYLREDTNQQQQQGRVRLSSCLLQPDSKALC